MQQLQLASRRRQIETSGGGLFRIYKIAIQALQDYSLILQLTRLWHSIFLVFSRKLLDPVAMANLGAILGPVASSSDG